MSKGRPPQSVPLSIAAWKRPDRVFSYRHDIKDKIQIVPDALKHSPEMAALVARVIACFSRSDLNTLLIISELLGGNRHLQFKMYSAATNESIQNKFLDLIKNEAPLEFIQFKALLTLFRGIKRQRHRLAHGIFATFEDNPLSIVVFDQDDYAQNVHEIADERLVNSLTGYELWKEDLEALNDYVESINVALWKIYMKLRAKFLLPNGTPNPAFPPGS